MEATIPLLIVLMLKEGVVSMKKGVGGRKEGELQEVVLTLSP